MHPDILLGLQLLLRVLVLRQVPINRSQQKMNLFIRLPWIRVAHLVYSLKLNDLCL
jgi:hypothetical protein